MGDILKKELEVSRPRSFILGGKSEFTVENLTTGVSFKYRVHKCKKSATMFFVSVRDGIDAWEYAGFLDVNPQTGKVKYIQGKKGSKGSDEPAIKGILYALRYQDKPLPQPMLMRHHGKCACCGKSLNDPESVLRGFGPKCWESLKHNGQVA